MKKLKTVSDNPPGLSGMIPAIGGALSTMIPMPQQPTEREQRDRMDDILRGVDRNLSTLTERVAHIQHGLDKLTAKLDKIDGDLITKEDYNFMKRWLTGTTIGLVVTAIVACIALAGVIVIIVYLGGLG